MSTTDLWTHSDTRIGTMDLTGFSVEAIDGSIGKIDEATTDVGSSYVVVDTGPWIFGKKVLLPAGVIDRVDTQEETVFVSRTKDEIKNAPEFDESRYTDPAYREEIGGYYGVGGRRLSRPSLGNRGSTLQRRAARRCSVLARSERGDEMTETMIWAFPGNVSDRQLDGFEVRAPDGTIGTVERATYDVGASYLVVDTGPWIFGKRVHAPGRRHPARRPRRGRRPRRQDETGDPVCAGVRGRSHRRVPRAARRALRWRRTRRPPGASAAEPAARRDARAVPPPPPRRSVRRSSAAGPAAVSRPTGRRRKSSTTRPSGSVSRGARR